MSEFLIFAIFFAALARVDLYRLGKTPIREPIVFYEGDESEEKEDNKEDE